MDQELINELRDLFINAISDRIMLLKQHIQSEALEQVQQLAHKIRGTGGTYGFSEVSEYGATIEEAAKSSDWEKINSGYVQLKTWLEVNK